MINYLLPVLVFSTIFERLNIFIPVLDFSMKLSLVILPIVGLAFLLRKRLTFAKAKLQPSVSEDGTFNPTFLFPALAAVLGVEILSVSTSFNPFQSFQVVVFHLLMAGLFYLIIWSTAPGVEPLKGFNPLSFLIWVWGMAAAVVSLLGIWQFLRYLGAADPTLFFENWFSAKTLPVDTFLQSFYGILSWSFRWDWGIPEAVLRPPSTFIDVSTGASFVGVFLILGLSRFLNFRKDDLRRVLMGGLMIFAAIYFVLALSRSAAFGLVTGSAVFSYLILKDRIRKWVKPLILVLAGLALAVGVVFTTSSRERLSSAIKRLDYARAAIEMVKVSPLLGVGAGNFENYYREVIKPGAPAGYPHSILLAWLGELGILGLVANLSLAGVLMLFLYRLFDRLKRDDAWKLPIAGLLSAYVALLAANVFHAHYGLEFTWVLLGLAVAGYYSAMSNVESKMSKVDVLGIKVDNITMEEAVEQVMGFFSSGKPAYVVTPNSEMIIAARKDKEFTRILNQADLAVPDTVGLVWASRIWGTPLKERVAGTDLFLRLCEEAGRRGGRILLLEGPEGLRSSSAAAGELRRRHPKIDVEVLVIGSDQDDQAISAIRNLSRGRDFDLLFVAYGHGKQERWISRNLSKIPVKVAVGVGGALDFIAGAQKRAPKLIRSLGLEWLYRLIRQPWRIKRQLALLPFIWLTFRESFKKI
ncbi:MAG: WecB/TagA/CpsF family glycosyltransferase [Patescibacteria group bacterium]